MYKNLWLKVQRGDNVRPVDNVSIHAVSQEAPPAICSPANEEARSAVRVRARGGSTLRGQELRGALMPQRGGRGITCGQTAGVDNGHTAQRGRGIHRGRGGIAPRGRCVTTLRGKSANLQRGRGFVACP